MVPITSLHATGVKLVDANAVASYGTYDHLMLLLGRLTNFASKDLSRKRRAGQGASSSVGSSPPFLGMFPITKVDVPMGFSPQPGLSPRSEPNEEVDPSISYQIALKEWEKICEAFEILQNHFGPEFKPLRAEYTDRRETPFGGTLQYRTFAVAGIWMNFYMGMIHLHRSHPSMPAAATQAAGKVARTTAEYATKIGQIAAGLSDDCSRMAEISTLLGAAFIESSFCLFVAAVQVRIRYNGEERASLRRLACSIEMTLRGTG